MYSFSRYWLMDVPTHLLTQNYWRKASRKLHSLHHGSFMFLHFEGIITHILGGFKSFKPSSFHGLLGSKGNNQEGSNLQPFATCHLLGGFSDRDSNPPRIKKHQQKYPHEPCLGLVSKFANPVESMYGIHSLDLPKGCIVSTIRAAHIPYLRFKQHALEYAGFNLNL